METNLKKERLWNLQLKQSKDTIPYDRWRKKKIKIKIYLSDNEPK
jgi:hypothetical protein